MIEISRKKTSGVAAALAVALLIVSASALIGNVQAQTSSSGATTITAYKSQIAVNVKSPYSASQWTDTVTVSEPVSGITAAFKQNGTGLLFYMSWQQSSSDCSDTNCYGGIELGYANNTAPMGSSSTPTTMILASPSFTGNVDEFISTGFFTPATVESQGYTAYTTCGLTLSGTTYTAVCYRPFSTPKDSPSTVTLSVGSTVELGFAVGEFNKPGTHLATNMQSYVLTVSSTALPSTVSTTQTVKPAAAPETFPGLNYDTLYVLAAVALLVGVVLGIGVSVTAKKAAGK